MTAPTYAHTQKAPPWLLLEAMAVYFFLAAWWTRTIPPLGFALIGMGGFMAVLGLAFRQLTVRDGGEALEVRFGPLPWFHTRVRYCDIRAVALGRSTIFERWGIHATLRGGWAWSLWGPDCVVITLPRGVLLIGSDDPINLAHFLEGKIGRA